MEIEIGPAGFDFLADVFDHHDADIEADALPFFEPDADVPLLALHFEVCAFVDLAEDAKAETDIVEDEGIDFGNLAVGLVEADGAADLFKEFGAGLFRFVTGARLKGNDLAGAAVVHLRGATTEDESTGDFAKERVFFHFGWGRRATGGIDLLAETLFLLGLLVGGEGLVVFGDDAVDGLFFPGITADGYDGLLFDFAVGSEFTLVLTAGVEEKVFLLVALHHALERGLDAVRGNDIALCFRTEGEDADKTKEIPHSCTLRSKKII